MAVMKITLYNPADNEPKASFSRSFVPWRLLKQAVKLTRELGKKGDDLNDEDIDALASLVVEAFGNQFSVQELNDGADIGEMMVVLQTIVSNASGAIAGNPTRPG